MLSEKTGLAESGERLRVLRASNVNRTHAFALRRKAFVKVHQHIWEAPEYMFKTGAGTSTTNWGWRTSGGTGRSSRRTGGWRVRMLTAATLAGEDDEKLLAWLTMIAREALDMHRLPAWQSAQIPPEKVAALWPAGVRPLAGTDVKALTGYPWNGLLAGQV